MRTDQIKLLLRVLIWGGVVLIALLRYFDVNPITIEPSSDAEPTTVPLKRASGEVAVVVDGAAIGQTTTQGSFRGTDWSYAWINTMEQEIGPLSVIESVNLPSADLRPFRILVLTRSVAKQGGTEDLVRQLRAFVDSGGVLILERPEGFLRAAFAADGRGGTRQPKVITNIKDLEPPFDSYMKSVPLNTTYVGSSGPLDGAENWLSMDGVPVIYSKRSGRGTAVVVEFNYGLLLTSLQQGRPRDDFTVANRYPETLLPALESNDLVTDARLLDNQIPYADLVEKYLVWVVLGAARPTVALWPFKDGAAGALLMTHDEEMMGDKATWMARWEKEQGHKATWFVIPTETFTATGARTLKAAGADVELHWNRPQEGQGLFDPVGFWKINPFMQARSLGRQRDDLKAIKKGEVAANRNHYLLWSEDYTGVFRELAAAGIVIDSTYGPDKGARGYLFGTGLPFWALDTTGLPMPVMEMPMLTAETLGGVDGAFMHRLFADSAETWHQSINVLFHPNVFRWRPTVEGYDLWLATYDLALDYDHWITTVTELYRFWRQRRMATVNSTFRQKGGDGVQGTTPGGEAPEDDTLLAKPPQDDLGEVSLQVEVTVSEDGHRVVVPDRFRGRRFREARRGATPDGQGGEPLLTPPVDTLGKRLRLVPLRKGHNAITAIYR